VYTEYAEVGSILPCKPRVEEVNYQLADRELISTNANSRKKENPVLTLILGILTALAFGLLSRLILDFGPFLTGLFTILGFLLIMIPLNLWLKKKMERIFADVQSTIERDQEKMKRQMSHLQGRMTGSTKGLQKQMEKQQSNSVQQALKVLDRMEPLKKWNLMAQKQADTMRAQLLYQAKDFEKADRYLQKSMNYDPLTVAMKITRLYQKGEIKKLEKLYKKVKRRFKGDKGILLHCLYAWILVKQGRTDEALDFLTDLKEKTDNPVVHENWAHLANGRFRRFSNAGLGESWYSLHLEQPRPQRAKQHGRGRKR